MLEKMDSFRYITVVVCCFLLFTQIGATSVTFLVTVPEETSPTDTVYIMGNKAELGSWDPAAVALNKNPDSKWQREFDFDTGTHLFYNYTKGSMLYIERGQVGESRNLRAYIVPDTAVIVHDTVYKWGQFGPYLSWVDDPQTTMVISWRTAKSGNAMIEYGLDSTYVFTKVDSTIGTLHSIELTGLQPSTTYHYRVSSSSGEMGVDNTFVTAKFSSEPFTFVAYGDTRTNDRDRAKVVARIIDIDPNIVFNTGDLVGDGRVDSKWRLWFSTNQDILDHIPYFVAIGNHEENAQLYYDYWHFPGNEQWYSFNYGNAHFICLSTETDMSGSQKSWLESDLVSASQSADWIFVFFHRPPYSSGPHGNYMQARLAWCNLFETYGVDIVFNGHDHDYERGLVNGVYYIVTGGGGAPLYSVGSSSWTIYSESTLHCCKISIDSLVLSFEAIKTDGTVFDSFSIDKTVGISENMEVQEAVELLKIWQCYPNPFHSSTNIRYQITKEGKVTLTVYSLAGQNIKTLVDKNLPAGLYTANWDGKDTYGNAVPAGIYFCRIKVETTSGESHFISAQKIVLLR